MKLSNVTAISLLVVLLCLYDTATCSETKAFPQIISNALEKYQKEGADHLIPNLLIGSPIEGDKQALSQANLIRQIEAFYGKYQKAELFKIVTITQSTTLIYFVMKYEKGPLYGSATVFNHNGKEVITTFNFHTDINNIFPSEITFK